MNATAIIALLTIINQTLQVMGETIKSVIASQPDDVKKILWERHVTLTQPLYDVMAKLANKIDNLVDKS